MTRQRARYVLVTGAGSGIGRAAALALALARAGFVVLAGVRKAVDGARLVAEAPSIRPVILDTTDPVQVESAVRTIGEIAGKNGLYGLVNNAGIALPGAFECDPFENAERQIATNVVGTLRVTKSLLPMLRAARGRIVVVSSLAGKLAMPFNAAHCGTKHFLEGMFDALRLELRRAGVGVVIVEPGTIRTSMIEKFSQSTGEALERVPAELQPIYGAPLRNMSGRLRAHVDRGTPPEVVAETIVTALTASKPKTRYAVGANARMMMTLAHLLPDRTKDALVRRFFNL